MRGAMGAASVGSDREFNTATGPGSGPPARTAPTPAPAPAPAPTPTPARSAKPRGGSRGDLRRRLSPLLADRVVLRLEHLPDDERAMLRAVYVDHRAAIDIAPLMGCTVRVVRRRINLAVQRILSPRFAFVMRERARWSPVRQRVGQSCFLWGRSLRDAARDLKLSIHTVRRHRDAIEAMFEMQPPAPAPARAQPQTQPQTRRSA